MTSGKASKPYICGVHAGVGSLGVDMIGLEDSPKPAGFVRSWLPVGEAVFYAQDLDGADSGVTIRTKQKRELLLNDREVESPHDRVGCHV